jgi:hypothetical protein
MNEKRNTSPADRFRNIMSEEQNRDAATTGRRYPKNASSPAFNLPKPGAQNQGQLRSAESSAISPISVTQVSRPGRYMPAFWTVASVLSLLFNVLLVVFLFGLMQTLGSLNASNLGPGVLGGLYTNFERMDQAHIKTTIPLQTVIPLDLTVPVQTTTAISLAKDVSIPGAHVRINTQLFNIDAPANVTLPAGTTLDVAMAFTVPVQAQVPVNLNVPVDIALRDTELHPALVGLQSTIRPLFCIVSPSAKSLTGQPVCR